MRKMQNLGATLVMAALAGLTTAPDVRADETLFDKDGMKLTGAFTGVAGFFGVGNTDFGAGNINTKAPTTGAVPANQRRTDREWVEVSVKPAVAVEASLGQQGTGYGLFSLVAQGTRGNGDATSSLAQQGLRSTTGDSPTHVDLEDAVVGWKSADIFKESLGTDSVDLSYGNQSLVVGDGLVIGSGIFNAFRRGAYYTSLAAAFQRTILLKLNPDGVPLRGNVFRLEDRADQKLLQGFDQPMAKLAGFNAEWFQAGEKKEGDDTAPADLWSLGVVYFNIYDADSNPAGYNTGGFSIGSTGTANGLNSGANRAGLNVFSFRAAGSFFAFDRDILLYGEYVGEQNGNSTRRTDANAWYIEPGYKLSSLPWTPQVNLRYAHFSGEGSPNGRTKHSYDPLFYTAGPRGYGSWYLGEVYGWYLGTPSNINVAMTSVSVAPTGTLTTGLIFYDFRFDKTAQFANPTITSDHALDEVDLYATWTPEKWLTLSGVLGFAVPGQGFKQAAQSFVAANGPAGRSVGSTIVLGEIVATLKF